MHTFMRLKLLPYMTQYHMVVCKSDKNECILHTANPIRVTNMSIEQSTTHHEHHQCRKYQTSYHILIFCLMFGLFPMSFQRIIFKYIVWFDSLDKIRFIKGHWESYMWFDFLLSFISLISGWRVCGRKWLDQYHNPWRK